MHTRIALAVTGAVTTAWLVLATEAADATPAPAKTAPKGHHPTNPIGHPVFPFPASWGLTRRDVTDLGAGLVIVVLLLVVLVLRVRRRRRAEVGRTPATKHRSFPQTAEAWRGSGLAAEPTGALPRFEASSVVLPEIRLAPGWHPVQGDRTRLAYWDGASWSAYLQWDGRQWIDPTKHLTH